MADDGDREAIPWWRTPGAIILWALIAALLMVLRERFLR